MQKIKDALKKAYQACWNAVKNTWWVITHPVSSWNKLSDKMAYGTLFLKDWYNAKSKRSAMDWGAIGVVAGFIWFLYMIAFPIETLLVTAGLLGVGFIFNYPSMMRYYRQVWAPRIAELKTQGKDILVMRREAQQAQARAEMDENLLNYERAHAKMATNAQRVASVGSQINQSRQAAKLADKAASTDTLDVAVCII